MTPQVMWFRRDLRTTDHPALAAAAASGPVLGLFCLDPALLATAGSVRIAALRACLAELDRQMGGNLVVRTGRPEHVVPESAREIGATAVHVTADHAPFGVARDERVRRALAASGVAWRPNGSNYAVPPGTVRTRAGEPFRVFTPFLRAWRTHRPGPVAPTRAVDWIRADGDPVTAGTVDPATGPPLGPAAAEGRLSRFVTDALADYDVDRDRPGVEGTSRLSVDLKWGTVHPRTVLEALAGAEPSAALDRFVAELAWREFHADVLHHHPASAWESMDPVIGAVATDSGPAADDAFAAWTAGRTGFPFVDAGMRQLAAEGWMHNRVRMVTASFLVKDLHLPWTRGARWFLDHLIDGDIASNQHGWQWVAGTGTDAAPYFRVFNPVLQGRKFDPDGDYVRRWIPELALVPTRWIHEPWAAPDAALTGYPPPIVDHGEEREEALRRLQVARDRRARPGRPAGPRP